VTGSGDNTREDTFLGRSMKKAKGIPPLKIQKKERKKNRGDPSIARGRNGLLRSGRALK